MEGRLETEQTAEDRKRIAELNEQIRQADRDSGSLEEKLKKIEEELTKFRKERSAVLHKIEASEELQKQLDVIDRLIKSLNQFIERYKKEKIELVQQQATELVQRILHKNHLVDQIRIEMQEYDPKSDSKHTLIHITVLGSGQGARDFGDLSMGERQIVVTALLHALIHESYFNFPVFIDSPLQKLDVLHKQGILEHFYVGLHTQTVLLPLLESELHEPEFELIRQHIDRCYLIAHENEASRFMPVGAAELFDRHRQLQARTTA